VIGVASTNRYGNARARFSNWGPWCDCCARGEDVFSTYVNWYGRIDGEPEIDVEDFDGWARWDGTSFAAPKVSAAIASLLVEIDEAILPVQAAELLLTGLAGVPVTPLTDFTLTPFPGVTLPHLHLG
jgi:subtilisin family serine protease